MSPPITNRIGENAKTYGFRYITQLSTDDDCKDNEGNYGQHLFITNKLCGIRKKMKKVEFYIYSPSVTNYVLSLGELTVKIRWMISVT